MTLLIRSSIKSGGFVWRWVLRVMDNGGRNIQLDQAEFTDMGPWNRNSILNMKACTVEKKGVKNLIKYLLKKHL